MKRYLYAFCWMLTAAWMGVFGVFMTYAYTQHGDFRNIIVAIFAGAFSVAFASLFLDRFVKAITHSVYAVKRID